MALHNAAAEQTAKRLGDLNDQYVKDITSLNIIISQSVGDREVTDAVLLGKDEQIKRLTDSISTAMEIDTEDIEVLKSRLAEKTVGFEYLENVISGLRTENAAHSLSIVAFEDARVASETQNGVQRENIIADKTPIEELQRKCETSDHDRGLLKAELEVASRTMVPRTN
eukprot:2430280-Heterocapsa_arctica.AAC.1